MGYWFLVYCDLVHCCKFSQKYVMEIKLITNQPCLWHQDICSYMVDINFLCDTHWYFENYSNLFWKYNIGDSALGDPVHCGTFVVYYQSDAIWPSAVSTCVEPGASPITYGLPGNADLEERIGLPQSIECWKVSQVLLRPCFFLMKIYD